MNCLRCEVARARIIAGLLWAVGKKSDEIAITLTALFGVLYFVDKDEIWRTTFPRNIKISGTVL